MISFYAILMVGSAILGLIFWLRLTKKDGSVIGLYIAALAGAFLGAKLAYLVCEGWLAWGDPTCWRQWATGKSILGALLGGYLTVEGIKRLAGIRTVTGDWFASFVPLAIAAGRIGCLTHGCCRGVLVAVPGFPVFRWPAVPVEFLFNVIAALGFWVLRRKRILCGQHFHIYMMAYGLFRFAHEPLRLTPKFGAGWSLYQGFALALFAVGLAGFLKRRNGREQQPQTS